MGGLGSGRRQNHEPRGLVERAFVLDVGDLTRGGLVPGRQGRLRLSAVLIAWRIDARFLIRKARDISVTVWFDHPTGHVLSELVIDVALPSSHRRAYLVCPRSDHGAGVSRLAARLYWPALDPGGFACRECHELAYLSSRTRGEPAWISRLKVAAGLAAPAD